MACLILNSSWLIALDVHTKHQCGVVSYFLHGRLGGEGEIDDDRAVKFVFPGGILPRIFELPPELKYFELLGRG